MKRKTMVALDKYIREHSKWGPAKVEERVRFFTLALCGETGELANLIKKEWRGDLGSAKSRKAADVAGRKAWNAKVDGELSDVGAYALMLADLRGRDLLADIYIKFMEVEGRANYQAAERKRRKRSRSWLGAAEARRKARALGSRLYKERAHA